MKGYYLFAPVESENAGGNSGVERKVRAQCEALNNYAECKVIILPPVEYSGSKKEKIVRRLPFTAAWRNWRYSGEFDDGDFLYIRQVYHDSSFVRYLRKIKKNNPKLKIVYEIPTYPYDAEARISVSNFPFLLKERLSRKRAAKYIDRIVTFYGQSEIWGVKCINLINGYDFSKVSIPERIKDNEKINIMSVSATAFWHGYDRVIEGLHNYYNGGGKENIIYHLVGNIVPEHQELVKKYSLEEHVIFYGRMSGEPLEKIYEKSFIGVDVLGGHRKNYPVSSSLKSREYCAYGLPLITSSPVDFMPKDYEYQFIAPYDDSPLDFNKVIEFYHSIYDNDTTENIASEIREFAISKCNMSITMKPVADWLKKSIKDD